MLSVFVFICLVMSWPVLSGEFYFMAELHPPKLSGKLSDFGPVPHQAHRKEQFPFSRHIQWQMKTPFWRVFGFPALLWFWTCELKRFCHWFFLLVRRGKKKFPSSGAMKCRHRAWGPCPAFHYGFITFGHTVPYNLTAWRITKLFLIFHSSTCQQK